MISVGVSWPVRVTGLKFESSCSPSALPSSKTPDYPAVYLALRSVKLHLDSLHHLADFIQPISTFGGLLFFKPCWIHLRL